MVGGVSDGLDGFCLRIQLISTSHDRKTEMAKFFDRQAVAA